MNGLELIGMLDVISKDWKEQDSVIEFWDNNVNQPVIKINFESCSKIFHNLADFLESEIKHGLVCIVSDFHIMIPVIILSCLKANRPFMPISSLMSFDYCDQKLKTFVSCIIKCSMQDVRDNSFHVLNIDDFNIYVKIFHNCTPMKIPDLCYVIQTSGTTSQTKKSIFINSKCILPNIVDLSDRFKTMISDSCILIPCPLTFDPSIVLIFMALRLKVPMVFTSKENLYNHKHLLNIIKNANIGFLQCTPSLMNDFKIEDFKQLFLNSKPIVCFGGESVPKTILDTIKKLKPIKPVFSLYGITEVSSWSSLVCINTNLESFLQGKHLLGHNLSSTKLRLNKRSEIEIQRINGGYYSLKLDENTSIDDISKYLDIASWEPTGDIGFEEADIGICFVCRNDRIVKRFGQKVNLALLENSVREAFSQIIKCCATLTNHDFLELCIFESNSTLKDLDIVNFISQTLSSAYIPSLTKIFYNSPQELPLLSEHGKTLPDPYCYTLNLLKSIIQNEFQHQEVCYSNFSELGGDSLKAIYLINCLDARYRFTTEIRTELLETLMNHNISTFLQKILLISRQDQRTTNTDFELSFKVPTALHSFGDRLNISLKISWSKYMGKCVDAGPIFSNDAVYIGSHAGNFAKIDAINGRFIWCLNEIFRGERIEASADYSENFKIVLIGSLEGSLYAFDMETGDLKWKFNSGGSIKCAPVIVELDHKTIILIGSHGRRFHCLNIEQLSPEAVASFSLELDNCPIVSKPAVDVSNETAFITTLGGNVFCVNFITGSIEWCYFAAHGPIFADPLFLDEFKRELVITTVTGIVAMINTNDGKEVWSIYLGVDVTSFHTSLFQDNRTLLIPCNISTFFVLDVIEKRVLKKLKFDEDNFQITSISKILLHNLPYFIFILNNGMIKLCKIDVDFQIISNLQLPAECFSKPCISNGKDDEAHFFVGCRDDHIYKVSIHNLK